MVYQNYTQFCWPHSLNTLFFLKDEKCLYRMSDFCIYMDLFLDMVYFILLIHISFYTSST